MRKSHAVLDVIIAKVDGLQDKVNSIAANIMSSGDLPREQQEAILDERKKVSDIPMDVPMRR